MQPTSDEIQDLRRCVRDLVALSTLPAIWGSADPLHIGRSLAEVLLRILSANFIYVRLHGRSSEPSREVARTRQRTKSPNLTQAIGQALAPWLQPDNPDTPPLIPNPLGDGMLRLAVFPIGHGKDHGLLAAGCGRSDFPTDSERLLLGVAVNQAAGLLQRKEAEEALRKQSEWLRVTLASIGDAVITTDTEGRVTSLNPVAESLTGWPLADAQGMSLERVFHIVNEQTHQPVENPVTRSLRLEQSVGLANRTVLIARDGTKRLIDDSAAPIKDEQGNVIGAVLIFRDVTEARRALELRLRLSAIVESCDDAIISKNLDGIIVSWNQGAERLYGYGAEEIIGKPLSLLIPSDHPDELPALMERLRRGERIEHYETVRVRKDGGRVDVSLTISPVRNAEGRIIGASKIARDITRQKHARHTTRFLADASAAFAELTDYESTLQKIASLAVPFFADWCAVDMQQADGTVRRLAVTHRDAARVQLAHELFCRYPPRPSDPSGVMKVLRTGKSDWATSLPDSLLLDLAQDEEHLRIIRALGLKSYICVPLCSHMQTQGALTFVTAESGRVYDADDLRAAEDLAHRAAVAIENTSLLAALKEADCRKDEFLAMLAHELRNPLAPLRNAVQILRAKGPPVPELQWARELIERQVQQMTRLVDDLLDISRITRGKIELRKERIELAEVVNSALEASRPLIEKWGHELTVALPMEPIFLEADRTRLAQVLMNLLNNAAKYTDQGGRIELTAELGAGEVLIRVKDTGIGISSEMLPHVFEMFVQVDRSLERAQGGLGIGLTLVDRLVEMHGGRVEAHSDGPGTGSEFVVRLPVARETQSRGAGEAYGTGEGMAAARCRILVVDDNRDAADSLAILLRMMGNEVHTAHDGLEAVGAAAVFHPDVALLDIGLPKLNGYEAGRRIRARQGKGVLLIALTGWGQEDARHRSKEAGFDHHITKPVEFDALQQLLAEIQREKR